MAKLKGTVELNVSDFEKGLQKAVNDAQKFKNGVDKLGNSDAFKRLGISAQQLQKDIGNDANAFTGFATSMSKNSNTIRQQIRQLQNAMADLASKGINQTTESYRAMQRELGRLMDIQSDVAASGRVWGNDNANIQAAIQGVGVLTAGYGALTASMQLLGIENEGVTEGIKRCMAATTMLNSVQQISMAFNKDSVLMLKVIKPLRAAVTAAIAGSTTATIANTGAQVANAAATTGVTNATKAATIAQRAYNLACKANPYILLATAVVAAGVAIYEFTKNANEAAKAEEKLQAETAATEGIMKAQKNAQDNLKNKTGELVGEFYRLRAEWLAVKGTAEQDQWIKNNQNGFKNIRSSVLDAADAFRVFERDAQKVVNALIAIAKAQGAQDYIKDLTKQYISGQSVSTGHYYTKATHDNLTWDEKKKFGIVKKGAKGAYYDYDYDAINKYRKQEALKRQQAYNDKYNAYIKNAEKTVRDNIAEANRLQKEAGMTNGNAPTAPKTNISGRGKNGSGKHGNGTSTTNTSKDIATQIAKDAAKLKESILDNEAKLGSDWKYTKEGQKAYEQYFDGLMALYIKDSEEYKKAQRDKWAYDRDNNSKQIANLRSDAEYTKAYAEAYGSNIYFESDQNEKYLKFLRAMLKYAQEGSDEYRKLTLEIYNFKKATEEARQSAEDMMDEFHKQRKNDDASFMVGGSKPRMITNKQANAVNAGFNSKAYNVAFQMDTYANLGDTKNYEKLKKEYDEIREAQRKWNEENVATGTSMDIMISKSAEITSTLSNIGNAMQSFEHLGDKFANAQTAVDKFVVAINLLTTALDSYQSVMTLVNSVVDMFTKKKEIETAVTTANTVAKGAETTANVASSASEIVSAGAAATNTAAKSAEKTATIGTAIAKMFESCAALGPWGLAIAAGSVAVMIAAIGAAIGMAQGFANGGVVGGTSYKGDRQMVRVNSGEMILNGRQQANLFNMINNGGSSLGGNVEFKIKGKELVGVLKNYNSVNARL